MKKQITRSLPHCTALGFLALVFGLPWASAAEPTVVLDFARDAETFTVEPEHAAARVTETADGRALCLEGSDEGGGPTVAIRAKQGTWDLSRFTHVAAEVRNVGTMAIRSVGFALQGPPDDGSAAPRVSQRRVQDLGPGERVLLSIPLPHAAGKDERGNPVHVFGMRTAPYGRLPQRGESDADPAQIQAIWFSIDRSPPGAALEVSRILGLGATVYETGGAGFFPFIDRYGQYLHDTWDGKAESDEDLHRQRQSEEQDLARWQRPADWNRWGGWQDGPTLEATGHFRSAKHEGRWWLVDPDGKLFFSHGVACVRCGDEMTAGTTTPITQREHYFRNLPAEDDPILGRFFYVKPDSSQIPEYRRQGVSPLCYNFSGANMLRKYGEGFERHAAELAHRRLAAWGYNSMGAWSDTRICGQQRTPYAHMFGDFRSVGPKLGSKETRGGAFADVFSLEFAASVRKGVHTVVRESRDDPWCIGYFFGNEMPWPELEVEIPCSTCQSPADHPAKRQMLEMLKKRYADIAALNQAWKSDFASWEDFLKRRTVPDLARASKDFHAFTAVFIDQYFRTIRAALDAEAPRKLYLGCRFNTWTVAPSRAAARHCHVVSFNVYKWPGWAGRFRIPGGADAPFLIGEWHFGTIDHGMFDPGITLVLDQRERARQYTAYMKAVLGNPQCVGAHWFRYMNHPTTGRASEGANAHNGLLDICDTPYRETVLAAREVGANLYRCRASGRWDGAEAE
ncbi:MAG: hypothetical protein ACOY3P_03970 [Planctomycetota bacterium]